MGVKELRGAVAAAITVFGIDETIDEKRTRKHLEFLLSNGIEGIVVCGTTGEAVMLSEDERKCVIDICLDQVAGRVPVYAGTGDSTTMRTISLSKYAEQAGADGVIVVTPWGMGATTNQVLDHYREIASAISLPLMLYNNPDVAGYDMPTAAIATLAKEGVIQSVKESEGSAQKLHELKFECPNLGLFYGHDVCVLEAMLVGVDGWISGFLNLAPRECRALTDAAASGNTDAIKRAWQRIFPVIQVELSVTRDRDPHWLSFIKDGLALLGHDVGAPRRPVKPLPETYKVALKAALAQAGLL